MSELLKKTCINKQFISTIILGSKGKQYLRDVEVINMTLELIEAF